MRPHDPELPALYEWAVNQSMLSPRQRQVLDLWAKGFGIKRTAIVLDIKTTTVREHRRRALEKLECAVLNLHVDVASDEYG